MIKYLTILCLNLFLLYCFVLFFIDNTIITAEPLVIVRNIILFAVALWIVYDVVTIYVQKKQKQERGLVYIVVSKGRTYGFAFYEHILPFRKEFINWSLAAMVLMFLGIISLGITGYIWLAIPVALGLVSELAGDSAWPAAILLSLTWPLLLPIAVLIKHHLIKSGNSAVAVPAFWCVIVGGIVLLVIAIYAVGG
jgi:hypothetical protein